MTPKFLTDEVKITKISDYESATTGDVTCTVIDMQGYDAVAFLASYGTPAANNLMHVEQSSDDASADPYTDIEGSEVDLSGASDEDQWVDIVDPEERYLRLICQRGTSTTLENAWAIQYKAKTLPQDNLVSGTIYGKQLVAPVAGTK